MNPGDQVQAAGGTTTGSETLLFEPGLLSRAFGIVAECAPAHRYVVITDETVGGLHLGTLTAGFPDPPLTIVIPPGEGEKNRERWAEITDRMLAQGCGRDTTVLALGGGVIGDLAGFVAATYMRGVPVVQLPTTLLAMVDASVGGKTAVDVAAGKNLVGAFHPPAAVLADPLVLATLPARHGRAGVAEMLKHGAIADPAHFAAVGTAALGLAALPGTDESADNVAPLGRLVSDSVAIKTAVVAEDPLEHGKRRILNFGHTIAHALEAASGYQLLHGEAVAIGMVLEARIAEEAGVAERGTAGELRRALEAAGLPHVLPAGIDVASLRSWMELDKKNAGGELAFALLRRIGEMESADGRWSVSVSSTLVERVLHEG